ncbi:MAG: L,D-transpeptidase family protein [Chitinophagales bacterium]
MKSFRNLLVLLFVAWIFSALFACKNKADAESAVDSDTTMVLTKVFHPLTLDSQTLSTFLAKYPDFNYHKDELFTFYRNRNFQSAWFNEYGIIEQGGFFMSQLDHFDDEGLNDSVLYYSELKKTYTTIADPQYNYAGADKITTQFELMLTAEFFVYAQKVWFGINEKTTKELDWYVTRKTVPSVAILDSILSGGKNSFTAYEPLYPQYQLLKKELKKYKLLTAEPWDSLKLPADKKSIKPGDDYSVIAAIKKRLYLLGDAAVLDSTTILDSTAVIAVEQFQLRHGLTADGVAGEKFFRELNISPAERVRQLEINMERMRWLPDVPSGDYIMVNIPEYTMHIFESDSLAWDMKVVVGKSSSSTTIFNDELEYIVFSPYWVPPPSILNNEILPALKKDPNYLKKENMEAVEPSTKKVVDVSNIDWDKYSKIPYIIRQKPGNSNSLGWVKFIFPNEHNIYFHDTPSRNLFEKESRSFSHGCIRIAEPKRFATYLLRNDTTYTEQKIDSLYYLGRETYVKLEEKIPVYLVYFTAWVDTNGLIHFNRDIYGHDAKLEHTLFPPKEVIQ